MTRTPVLFAVFAFRHDAHLVPDLLRNISFVDGVVSHDDRDNPEPWFDEGNVRSRLIDDARARGAEWVLVIDPDERLERGAGEVIRSFMRAHDGRALLGGFRFRELWTPTSFRSDGIWGEKRKFALFSVIDGLEMSQAPVHTPRHPLNAEYQRAMLDLNIYHLKMLSSSARTARRDLYTALDPSRAFQPIGYDYLTDETDLALTMIPSTRRFGPRRPGWWLRRQVERSTRAQRPVSPLS
jgi:hypothetical protein